MYMTASIYVLFVYNNSVCILFTRASTMWARQHCKSSINTNDQCKQVVIDEVFACIKNNRVRNPLEFVTIKFDSRKMYLREGVAPNQFQHLS